jgi:hypothetical protein
MVAETLECLSQAKRTAISYSPDSFEINLDVDDFSSHTGLAYDLAIRADEYAAAEAHSSGLQHHFYP